MTGAAAPGQAAEPVPCEHHWVSQHKPGHAVYWVRLCGFCGDPDWDDLDRQIAEAIAAAAPAPQAAPGSLRAELEETLADWRDDATYRPTDTRDEMSEHRGVTGCADTLAGILADHPAPEAQPAPEVRTCYCGTTATVVPGVFPHRDCDGSALAQPAPELAALRKQLDDFTRTVINVSGRPALTALARDIRKRHELGDL